MMQTSKDLDALVKQVASQSLKGHVVAQVFSEPTSDSLGQDALHITVVVADDDDGLSGDLALDTIVDIGQALQKAGEQRTPIISFTNESELEADVDPEFRPSP